MVFAGTTPIACPVVVSKSSTAFPFAEVMDLLKPLLGASVLIILIASLITAININMGRGFAGLKPWPMQELFAQITLIANRECALTVVIEPKSAGLLKALKPKWDFSVLKTQIANPIAAVMAEPLFHFVRRLGVSF